VLSIYLFLYILSLLGLLRFHDIKNNSREPVDDSERHSGLAGLHREALVMEHYVTKLTKRRLLAVLDIQLRHL